MCRSITSVAVVCIVLVIASTATHCKDANLLTIPTEPVHLFTPTRLWWCEPYIDGIHHLGVHDCCV